MRIFLVILILLVLGLTAERRRTTPDCGTEAAKGFWLSESECRAHKAEVDEMLRNAPGGR
jgi:hypothetical protein